MADPSEIDSEDDPAVTAALAIALVPFSTLKGLYIPTEGVMFHLAYAVRDPPPELRGQAIKECLGVVCNPNDPVHASRRATP